MKHLIICPEYPPAPSGGIGTYVVHIARLLAEYGDTVHVIGPLGGGAGGEIEEQCGGRLIIHRVPFGNWNSYGDHSQLTHEESDVARKLYTSHLPNQAFSWQAAILAERLVEREGIDLVEAQEYEAPLYYFQLRRSLGLGPKRNPPTIVHLHSPTEFIALHDGWDIHTPALSLTKRLEDYSIASADGLLCPSRYLARQAECHYGLAAERIQVIPLPIGDSALLDRDQVTWSRGTICYVGRLEPRKGVIEWVDAALELAQEHPELDFEFIGSDCRYSGTVTVGQLLKARIPNRLKGRFHFRGAQKRADLPRFLAQARIAVVPSRWENFPNTCVEAMCSGLPVLVTPEGGMAEMLTDGESGWHAASPSSADLAAALRRALATPPDRLATMGRQAAQEIRRLCDNEAILSEHLAYRSQIVQQGATRSLHLPGNLTLVGQTAAERAGGTVALNSAAAGLAVVILAAGDGAALNTTLYSIEDQVRHPLAVGVIHDELTDNQGRLAIERASQSGWLVEQRRYDEFVAAKNDMIAALLAKNPQLLGFVFVNAGDWLTPEFIEITEGILRRCPEVGLVSCWSWLENNAVSMMPSPEFPYQWVADEAASCSVVRAVALCEAGGFRPQLGYGYESWDLHNAIMVAGWVAVTAPVFLARVSHSAEQAALMDANLRGRMRGLLLDRFPERLAGDARTIVLLAEASKDPAMPGSISLVFRQEGLKRFLKRQLIERLPWKALRMLKQIKQWLRQRSSGRMATFIARLTS